LIFFLKRKNIDNSQPREPTPMCNVEVMVEQSDVDQPRNISKDPLHVPNGPMTRSKTKRLKEALNTLVLNVSTKSELKGPLEYQEETLVYLIHVQEESNTTLFGP
jgi:hypothetical protein